jgi:hypothetical protein
VYPPARSDHSGWPIPLAISTTTHSQANAAAAGHALRTGQKKHHKPKAKIDTLMTTKPRSRLEDTKPVIKRAGGITSHRRPMYSSMEWAAWAKTSAPKASWKRDIVASTFQLSGRPVRAYPLEGTVGCHDGDPGTNPYFDITAMRAALSGGPPAFTTAATSLKYWAPMSGEFTIKAFAVSGNGFANA